MKNCPTCNRDLDINDFGICKARRDGRNLYCKSCIRGKVNASRQALRKYKAARKQRLAELGPAAEPPPTIIFSQQDKPTLVDRVREAIKNGARTQTEIHHETRLDNEQIGEAITDLLLWTHEIKTRMVDGSRMYFMNTVEERPQINYPVSLSLIDLAHKNLGPVIRGCRKVEKVA